MKQETTDETIKWHSDALRQAVDEAKRQKEILEKLGCLVSAESKEIDRANMLSMQYRHWLDFPDVEIRVVHRKEY